VHFNINNTHRLMPLENRIILHSLLSSSLVNYVVQPVVAEGSKIAFYEILGRVKDVNDGVFHPIHQGIATKYTKMVIYYAHSLVKNGFLHNNKVSFNISNDEVNQDTVSLILYLFDTKELKDKIIIEITEDVLIDHHKASLLEKFKACGIEIALDDFCSEKSVRDLICDYDFIDIVKFDGVFMQAINKGKKELIDGLKHLNSFAKTLGKKLLLNILKMRLYYLPLMKLEQITYKVISLGNLIQLIFMKGEFKLKKILAISLVLASMLYADDNKTQIYMEKYLPDSKMKQFEISPEELREKSKGLNLGEMKTNMEMNQTEFDKKFGEIQTVKSKSADEQAKEVSDFVRTDKFQKGVAENEKYILYDKSIDWSKYTGKYNNQTKEIMEQLETTNSPLLSKNKFLNPNEKIFIVISSSLEKETIRNYFKMLENVNTDVTFILRGVIGTPKKIMPTIEYINGLLVKDTSKDVNDQSNRYSFNVEINPKVTRRFDVKQVPAVLFIKNYNPVVQEYKEIIGTPDKDELYWIAYGEASIDYALEQINKKAKSDGIERLLKAMNQSYYNKGE